MRKVLLCTVLCTVFCVAAFARTDEDKRSAFQFSFVYPLSTNGRFAYTYDNGFSLNLLAGISRSESAGAFGGLANVVRHDMNGVAVAGLVNLVGHGAHGFSMAGLANYSGRERKGIHIAGLGNHTVGRFHGLQLGGVTNMVFHSTQGFSVAGLTNLIGGDSNGLTFAGLANLVGGNMNGFSLAGTLNISSGYGSGIQISGLSNVTTGVVTGLQFAGIANIAGETKGLQFAGLVNVARKVKGVQFAGLVNIADSCDYPIGIVNLIRSGEKSIALLYDETGNATASFRSGGKVLYGVAGFGVNTRIGTRALILEAGWGARVKFGSALRLNNELTTKHVAFTNKATFKSSYTLSLAWRIMKSAEIFAGPSISYMYSNDPRNNEIFPSSSLWEKRNDAKHQAIFAGYSAGIQYLF